VSPTTRDRGCPAHPARVWAPRGPCTCPPETPTTDNETIELFELPLTDARRRAPDALTEG
jgi:hypothetical protein